MVFRYTLGDLRATLSTKFNVFAISYVVEHFELIIFIFRYQIERLDLALP